MVDLYPYPITQIQSPYIIATLTTNVVIGASSTFSIQVRELSSYRNNLLFFQVAGPISTIYAYFYYSPDGVNYDTVPQATITIVMTSTIFNYSWIFPTPAPYVQYGLSPTNTITLNYLGVIYF